MPPGTADRPLEDLTIAVAHAGDPSDPAEFSGAPAALMRGLEELGVRAVPAGGKLSDRTQSLAARAVILSGLRPADVRDVRGAIERERHRVALGRAMLALRRRVLGRALRDARPDGIVQHGGEFPMPGSAPVVTYEDATFPLAVRTWDWPHLHGVTERDVAFYSERQRAAYARATACATMSHWAADSIVADQGQPEAKVHTVGLGANHAKTAPAARDWSVPHFLFLGQDWERKNGDALVRAFARLREEHPEATLDLVGGHPRVDVPGVTGHGRLSLAVEADRAKTAALYARATCFTMPSLHEPSGIVFAETLHAGLPAIGTTSGGCVSIIGDAGVVVDPADDAAILAALRRCADPAEAARFGERALARAPLFTWRAVAGRMIRLLAIPGVPVDGLAEPLPPLPAAAASPAGA